MDANQWKEVAKIKGEGNSGVVKHYFHTDEINSEGITYYRLSQVDIDDTKEIFKIIDVNCKANNNEELIIYPNPASNEVTILINSNQSSANSV